MKSRVVLLRCAGYSEELVYRVLKKGIDLLGGAEVFVKKGERILLKPNILAGEPPEKNVTTHPAVLKAAIRIFMEAGAVLSCGDSPGFERYAGAARISGLAAAAEDFGVPMADFTRGEKTSFPEGKVCREFFIAKGVLGADGLISLSKLKTHGLTRITGAVKNQYGCIQGLAKAAFHAKYQDIRQFSLLLADLNLFIKPRLCILDGIEAMDGDGPRNGTTYPLQGLIISADPVAADSVFCRLIGLDPAFVPTNKAGLESGLGTFLEEDITLLGDSIEDLKAPNFKVIPFPVLENAPYAYYRAAKALLLPRPALKPDLCRRCGDCEKVCPVPDKAVRMNKKKKLPEFNYNICIRCFCCQEMCGAGAIKRNTPLLGQIFFFFKALPKQKKKAKLR